MAYKAAILCALVALAAMTAARSVPAAATEDDGTQVVFVLDADSEAVTADAGDFAIEEDSDMAFEEAARDKRRKRTAIIVLL